MKKTFPHFIAGAALFTISSTSVATIFINTEASATTNHSSISSSANFGHILITAKDTKGSSGNKSSSGGFHPLKALGSLIRGAFHTVTHAVSSVVHTVTSIATTPFRALSSIGSVIGGLAKTVGSVVGEVVHTVASYAPHTIAAVASYFLPVDYSTVNAAITAAIHPFWTLTHPFADFKWLIGDQNDDQTDAPYGLGITPLPGFLKGESLLGTLLGDWSSPPPDSVPILRLDYFNLYPVANQLTFGSLDILGNLGDDIVSTGANAVAGVVKIAGSTLSGLAHGALGLAKAVLNDFPVGIPTPKPVTPPPATAKQATESEALLAQPDLDPAEGTPQENPSILGH